ncbi:hypothetical protein IWX78_000434 [Mycetocola sp. CAN_C7]|uniref:hypothetical protein n=1 Tax=Mycetocola sp. CAN_C7 TaxID=2787724 RepID=UPI0018C9B7C6
MRGKLIFVAGLATGYVLGSRAGRARYEQIKKNWLKVWNTDVVQDKVEIVEGFAKARASEIPGALFAGVKKVSTAIGGDGTPGQKLDATIAKTKDAVDDVVEKVKPESSTTKSNGSGSKNSSTTSTTK